MKEELEKLIKEFEADAEFLEHFAEVYQAKDQDLQYHVLWHEALTYRWCAGRLKELLEGEAPW